MIFINTVFSILYCSFYNIWASQAQTWWLRTASRPRATRAGIDAEKEGKGFAAAGTYAGLLWAYALLDPFGDLTTWVEQGLTLALANKRRWVRKSKGLSRDFSKIRHRMLRLHLVSGRNIRGDSGKIRAGQEHAR